MEILCDSVLFRDSLGNCELTFDSSNKNKKRSIVIENFGDQMLKVMLIFLF